MFVSTDSIVIDLSSTQIVFNQRILLNTHTENTNSLNVSHSGTKFEQFSNHMSISFRELRRRPHQIPRRDFANKGDSIILCKKKKLGTSSTGWYFVSDSIIKLAVIVIVSILPIKLSVIA